MCSQLQPVVVINILAGRGRYRNVCQWRRKQRENLKYGVNKFSTVQKDQVQIGCGIELLKTMATTARLRSRLEIEWALPAFDRLDVE